VPLGRALLARLQAGQPIQQIGPPQLLHHEIHPLPLDELQNVADHIVISTSIDAHHLDELHVPLPRQLQHAAFDLLHLGVLARDVQALDRVRLSRGEKPEGVQAQLGGLGSDDLAEPAGAEGAGEPEVIRQRSRRGKDAHELAGLLHVIEAVPHH